MSEKFWTPKRERQGRISEEEQLRAGEEFLDERKNTQVKNAENSDGDDSIETELEEQDIPKGLKETTSMLSGSPELPGLIYSWYEKAIKRREREPLERDSFVRHFFEENNYESMYAYGDSERGYLLGVLKHGVFIPTHFAPKSLRGGVDLVEELGESEDIPSVMAITPDLKDTITKIPTWRFLKVGRFMSFFRGKEIPKDIVYNSHPEVKKLMWGLLKDYMKGLKEE